MSGMTLQKNVKKESANNLGISLNSSPEFDQVSEKSTPEKKKKKSKKPSKKPSVSQLSSAKSKMESPLDGIEEQDEEDEKISPAGINKTAVVPSMSDIHVDLVTED
jgi:hypothetical protein